jgi:hypothetical protein
LARREKFTPMSRAARLVVIAVVVVVIVVAASLQHRARGERPTTATATLANGLVVDVAHVDGTERAAAALLFRVGSDQDPPGRSGLASVLRRVVRARLDDTTTPCPVAIDGGVDGGVDGDGSFTVLSTAGDPRDVDSTVNVLGHLLAAPTLTDDVVTAARAAAVDEVGRRRGADPQLAAESWALESVAPSRGNGWRGGLADELAAVSRADVEGLWRVVFGADVASVTITGDVDVDDVIANVERALGSLPRAAASTLRPSATTFVHGTLVMGDQPRAVAVATPGPLPGDASWAPFLVVASRLQVAASTAKFAVHFDPAMAAHLVVVSPLTDGESADAGAARLRAAIVDVVQRPLAADEPASAAARYAVFLGDVGACAQHLRECAVARARRAQQGLDGATLARALATTTSLDSAASWFDEQHTSIAAAGGVLR